MSIRMNRRDLISKYGPAGFFAAACFRFDRAMAAGIPGKYIFMKSNAGFWMDKIYPTSPENATLTAAGLQGCSLAALSGLASIASVHRGVNFSYSGGNTAGDGHNQGGIWLATGGDPTQEGTTTEGTSDMHYATCASIDFLVNQVRKRDGMRIRIAFDDFKGRPSGIASYNSEGRGLATEDSPRNVFENVFGGKGSLISDFCKGAAQPKPMLPPAGGNATQVQQSLVDANLEDFNSLLGSKRISKTEKDALQKMMALYSKVEAQQAASIAQPPPPTLQPEANGQRCATINTDKLGGGDPGGGAGNIDARADLYFDTVALAFALDLRDTAVLTWTDTNQYGMNYVGQVTNHQASHTNENPNGLDLVKNIIQYDEYHAGKFASLGNKLAALDSGGVSVLDSTIMLWSSELSNGAGHDRGNVPHMFLGGKDLNMPQGRDFNHGGQSSTRLLTAIGTRLGVPENQIGAEGGRAGGVLF